ncbi:MAG: hypothetical protein Q8Q38_02670 [bacterium]|nr:hypothetical protein [bacterium]
MISDRQRDILYKTIRVYVETAEPVSSLHLAEEVASSPATIRHELSELTRLGLLTQPHISSGRVPTERGYRLLVNEVLLEEDGAEAVEPESNPFQMARRLAELSSSLILSLFPKEELFVKEGWERLISEPEFASRESTLQLIEFLHDLELGLKRARADSFSVFIGEENPFSRVRSFSVITASWRGGMVALVGPTRMEYERNIGLMKALMA